MIRLDISHLPSGATPKPVLLWWSGTDAAPADADRLWQTYLRRFDIEHTFRLFKQTLGWTSPKIRTPTQPPMDLIPFQRPRRLRSSHRGVRVVRVVTPTSSWACEASG
ncbi:hypothetical protein GCM10022295_89320 [Streptomyces osmaniensis]|uniref:Transposase n=1 Tax=Streptomyces osmaniensis TaxID=593134 RepID=A0ABP6Z150_9ACTN